MTAHSFPDDFLDRLDAAVRVREGTDQHGEVRFRCPAEGYPDLHPSARWNRAKGVWHCDACGAGGGALDLAERLGVERPTSSSQQATPRHRSGCEGVKAGETRVATQDAVVDDDGVTLARLAEVKRLLVAFLQSLGLRDQKLQRRPAVVIPFLGEDGEEITVRYRVAFEGDQRFKWRSGSRAMLYGLQRLSWIRSRGWVLLVEGESDCWTCWHLGLPALGIPGKSTWRPGWAALLDGLDVLVWREPDAADLIARIAKDLPTARVIVAPADTKDLSTAHRRGEDAAALVERLKSTALPITAAASVNDQDEADRFLAAAAIVLDAPDPLVLVEDEVARLGYGGNVDFAIITYLCLTTRLLAMRRGTMPAHLLLLGPPSAGKSYTLGIVLVLLPASAYHVIDAGSPRVLIYDDADLRHRVAVFAEADSLPAGEDNPAASAVRNLLQDHHLHYKVTVKDAETGEFTVRTIAKDGPTLLVTTAVKSLGSQMMSRLFALAVPEDAKRLAEALEAQAILELEGAPEPDQALVAAQAYLQSHAPWEVVAPFARALASGIARSANATRIMRDYQRLLSLIKAVAVLRHRQRARGANGRLVATFADYQTVYDLVGPMFEASVSGATATVSRVVTAVGELAANGVEEITYSAVARHIGLHPEQVKRAVAVAIGREWLVNAEERPNRSVALEIGGPMPDRFGLPSPAELGANQPFVDPAPDGRKHAPGGHKSGSNGSGHFTPSHADRWEQSELLHTPMIGGYGTGFSAVAQSNGQGVKA